MAEGLVTNNAVGVGENDCVISDFQCFEEEIRELLCPKVSRR